MSAIDEPGTDVAATSAAFPTSGQVMLDVSTILAARSDLVEEVIDVPQWGGSIRVRSLTAAESARVREAYIKLRGAETHLVFAELEKRQFEYAVVEPKFTKQQVNQLFHQSSTSWRLVIDAIDRISGMSKADLEEAEAAFPAGGGDGA